MHKLSYADYVNLLDAVERGVPLSATQQQVVRAAVQAALAATPDAVNTRDFVLQAIKNAYTFVDPKAPQTLFVEYVGAVRQRESQTLNAWGRRQRMMVECSTCRGSGLFPRGSMLDCRACNGQGRVTVNAERVEPYASAWVDGGWSVIFTESVLRAFFTFETPFDGNFHKLLLSSSDLNKTYKQLARKYHPDVNQGRSKYFLKLRKAYDDLKDPKMRKRYEAGLKFQQVVEKKENEAVLYVPKSCGNVTVVGEHDERDRLVVAQILAWEDIVDELGRTLTAEWIGSAKGVALPRTSDKPFRHVYQFKGDLEFEVAV